MNDALQFAPEHGHPDADQLTAFAEHTLPEHERAHTLAHLATCSACRQIVFLAQPVEEEVRPQPVAVRKPIFAGWTLAWISAGALAGAAVLTLALRSRAGSPAPAPVTRAAVGNPSPSPPPVAVPTAPPGKLKRAPTAVVPSPAKVAAAATTAAPQSDAQQAQLLPYSPFLRSRAGTAAPPPVSDGGRPMGYAAGSGVGAGVASPPAAKPAPVVVGAAAVPATAALPPSVNKAALPLLAPPSPPPPAPAPQAASQTVTVSAHGNQVAVEPGSNSSATILTGKDLDALSDDPDAHFGALPSHLPSVSTVSNGARTVAIDARGAVFVSKDAGKHWDAVSAPWPGRAVRVSLLASSDEARANAPQIGIAGAADEPKRATIPGRSDLSGSVTDATGAAIPGAAVRLSGKEVHTTRASQSGQFTLVGLDPGAYSLEVSARGFETAVRQIDLHAGDRMSLPIVLSISSVSSTVDVTAASSMIETENASLPEEKRKVTRKSESKPAAFQLTTESGATYTSTDGKKWKRR